MIRIIGSYDNNYGYDYDDDEENEEETEVFDESSINAGSGNDLIEIQSLHHETHKVFNNSSGKQKTWIAEEYSTGKKITIAGGAGNDTIRNAFIDLLYLSSSTQTITVDYGFGLVGNKETIKSHFESPTEYVKTDTIKYSDGSGYSVTSTYKIIYDRTIQYANGDGDDVVEDYHETDTIQITDGSSYTTLISGNDVIIKVGSGSITLKDAKGKNIFIGDPEDNPYTDNEDDNDIEFVYLDNSNKSPYTADSDVIGIDASARTKAIKIIGNSNNNVFIGGSKNDTFTGGSGNDTFVSSAGKDIITDYAEGDIVSIVGSIDKTAFAKNNVTFTSGKNTMTLQNVKGKKITFVDDEGNVTKQTFGVNKLNIVDGDGSTINVANDATVITLDASDRTEDIILIGNAKANT
ncbi:MAG: hypothetical protein IJ728_13195, partial [Selenomonadaceae bacterium]|nr:hypothetical protein [Selenomonadaceae bacterium]